MGKGKNFRRLCQDCLTEFDLRGGGGSCPACGSDKWVFIDGAGRRRIPVVEAMAARRFPEDGPVSPRRESWVDDMIRQWHPELAVAAEKGGTYETA